MDWIAPMEPISSDTIKTGKDWIYQIKWDGIRGLIYYQKAQTNRYGFLPKTRERTLFYRNYN